MSKKNKIYLPKLFVDMDGVLAEYRIYCGEHEMQQKNYFYSLKPEWNIVEAVTNMPQFVDVYILTKVYPSCFKYSPEEKKKWVEKYLPNFNMDHFIMVNGEVEEKSQAIKRVLGVELDKNCYLIDDYNPNLEEWISKGGTPIKYANGVNDHNRTFEGFRFSYEMDYKKIIESFLEIDKKVSREIA